MDYLLQQTFSLSTIYECPRTSGLVKLISKSILSKFDTVICVLSAFLSQFWGLVIRTVLRVRHSWIRAILPIYSLFLHMKSLNHHFRISLLSTCFFMTICACTTMSDKLAGASFHQKKPSSKSAPTPKPDSEPSKPAQLFHISNMGLMAKLMKSDEEFVSAVNYVMSFTKYVEQSALQFLKNHKPPLYGQIFMPCNHKGAGFLKSFKSHLEQRGFPTPDVSCLTEFHGIQTFPDEETKFTAVGLDHAIRTSLERIYVNRFRIADLIIGNWKEPDVGRMYDYDTTAKKCIINEAPGIRIGTKWYFRMLVTNAPLEKNLPLLSRQYISEYVHVNKEGKMEAALPFKLTMRPPENDTSPQILQNDTTTSLDLRRGSAGPHMYGHIDPPFIPSVAAAMELSDSSIQQANDALTPSSLAILILPLALNLIPLASLTKVTSIGMLMYTLMSDVLTVIPLAIKGVELIIIGQERHTAAAIRFSTAANGSLPESAAMELWTAECKARDNVLPAGIAFVSLAIIFCAIGVTLEYMCNKYASRRKVSRRTEHEPFLRSSSEVRSNNHTSKNLVQMA